MITLLFLVVATFLMIGFAFSASHEGDIREAMVFFGFALWGGAAIGQCLVALGWFA